MIKAKIKIIRTNLALLTVFALFLAPVQSNLWLGVVFAHEHENDQTDGDNNNSHDEEPPLIVENNHGDPELLDDPEIHENPEEQEGQEEPEHPENPQHGDDPGNSHEDEPDHQDDEEDNHSGGSGHPDEPGQPDFPAECSGAIEDYNLIIGTASSETLEGTDGADFIFGDNGNDIINALGGADCVDAGDGNDIVNGDNGADVILGGEGNDIIDGGADLDTCLGGPGHNIITNCEDGGDEEPPGHGEEPPGEEEPPAEPEPAVIGGLKFNDANGNGVKDSEESGLSGWTINLTGAATTSTTTDANGGYIFAALTAGAYQVCEDLQDGWLQTHPATTTPSAAECSNGTVGYGIELTADEISAGNDFGNTQTATTTPPGNNVPPASNGGGGSSGGSSGPGTSGPGSNQSSGPVFAAACVASPLTAGIGESVLFAAGEANGTAPVGFAWSGDISGSGLTQTASFATAGVKNVIVTATDSTGSVATGNCSVSVVSGATASELGLGGAPGETGPAGAPAGPGELEEETSSENEGETASERGGLLAAITQAGVGTILLWILIALVIAGIILFLFMWRRREEEQKPGGPKGPPSGGARPPIIPL